MEAVEGDNLDAPNDLDDLDDLDHLDAPLLHFRVGHVFVEHDTHQHGRVLNHLQQLHDLLILAHYFLRLALHDPLGLVLPLLEHLLWVVAGLLQ